MEAKEKTTGKSDLIRATFRCPYLDKLVDVDSEDLHFYGHYHLGGFQGDGYSEVIINFMCECGNEHYITICN